ncbi:MAG TPA: hypothetical protein VEX86_20235 [Longimicrobium sp.]|nr:hypothetical protein [Longimicrobium sp.]
MDETSPPAATLAEALPATFTSPERFPLPYPRMVRGDSQGVAWVARMAESRHHRARGYECGGFVKPISKCFAPLPPAEPAEGA